MEVIEETTLMKRQAGETDSDNGDLKPLVGLKEEAAENNGGLKNSFFFDKNEASLTCVVVLAMGKAYTTQRGQHKFTTYLKTILYYLATAIMASGVGFAVGELVKKLMEKLGWSEPNQAAT